MKVAKLTAELGADIAKFRAAVKEAERELISFTKIQERVGQSAILQNQRIADSEQKLVNVSHQLLSAEKNIENARNAQIKQLLGIENTKRRLLEAQSRLLAVEANELSTVEAKTAALNRVKNLENNLTTQRIQLANAVNTLSKAENNLNRVKESSILQVRKHSALIETEKELAIKNAQAKVGAEQAIKDAKNASHNLAIKQAQQEEVIRRKNEVEYTQWWEKRIAQQDALTAKERKLAEAQAYQISMIGRLSGAYSNLHRVQTFFSNSATSMTATVTLPFALLAKSSFEASVKMEAYQIAIENVVGSSEKAKIELEKLYEIAQQPGLEFEGLARAFPRILKFSKDTAEATRILQEFGNQLGLQKASSDEIRRTFENIPQIMAMKSLVGQETQQMSRLLMDFRSALVRKFGTAEGKELAKQGLSGKDIILGLTEEFSKANRAIDSTQNKVKNLKQEFFRLNAEIGDEFKQLFVELAPVLIGTLRDATNWFKSLSPEVKKGIVSFGLFAAAIGPVMGLMAGLIGIGRTGIGVLTAFARAIVFVFPASQFAQLIGGYASISTAATAAGTASTVAAGASAASWGAAIVPLLPYIAAIAAVGLAIYGIKKAYDAANPSIDELSQKIYDQNKKASVIAKQEKDVAQLVARYGQLKDSLTKIKAGTEESNSVKKEMFNILQDIYRLQPDYITKLDSEGNAIAINESNLKDYNKVLSEKIRLQKEAMALENAGKIQQIATRLSELKDQRLAVVDQINKYKDSFRSSGTGKSAYGSLEDAALLNKLYGNVDNPTSEAGKHLSELTKKWAELGKEIDKQKEALELANSALKNLSSTEKNLTKPVTANVGSSNSSASVEKAIAGFTEAQLEAMARYINTPAGQNSCGYFASQMIEAMYGVDVPGKFGIGRAGNGNGLEDWLKDKGATLVSRDNARAGDIMFMPGKGPSGVHVGVFDGRNMIDSSGKPAQFGDRSKISFDKGIPSSARFYRVPWDQKDGQQAVQSMRDQETAAEKLNRLVISQKEKTQELLAQMQEITPETKYQAMYTKMMADYYSEYGGMVPARLRDEVRATVEAQKMLDIWTKNYEVRQQIEDLNKQEKIRGYSEREKRVINAFGIDKWFDPQIKQSSKDSFAQMFNKNFDLDQMQNAFKSLGDLSKQVKEFYLDISGKGFVTKSEEANSQIEQILKGIENAAMRTNPWILLITDGIRKLAKEADNAEIRKLMSELDSPITRNMQLLNQQLSGTYSPRQFALQEYTSQNRDSFKRVGFENSLSLMVKFLKDYDLSKKAEEVFAYRQQMEALNMTYQELSSNSAFDVWLSQQKQWNDEVKRFELPPELADPKNARNIFDSQAKNDNLQRYNSLLADTTLRMAELSANSPFERWRVSLMEMDQAGNLQPLIADFKVLEQMFANEQLMNLIEQFADGVQDIFSNMVFDIAEKGFKGMFANIYAGFQKLLFKMAVEYLSSILYQSLLGSLFSGFGLGGKPAGKASSGFVPILGAIAPAGFATGGSVHAKEIIQVGEHGKELFVPNSDGYIVPNHVINNLFGGASSLSRYSSSAYRVNNYGDSSGDNVVNHGDSSSSQIVIVNNNYYGTESARQRTGRSVNQQVTEAQRIVDRVNQRIK